MYKIAINHETFNSYVISSIADKLPRSGATNWFHHCFSHHNHCRTRKQ